MASHLNATEFQISTTQTITGISTTVNNSNSEISTSKAIKDFIDYAVRPISLTVSGSWTNTQYTSQPVDTTGLSFTVTYGSGKTASVTPSVSPSKWSSTVGTQTATFSHTERGITVSATKSANVEVPVSPVLNDNSWATIRQIADAGTASQYWSVGDYKEVSVAAGTVDRATLTANTYRAVIIGINHNPTWENPNSIDFVIGQDTSDTDIGFRGSNYGIRMNGTGITTGGWTGSQMYLTYLPQFYNLLSGNTGLQSAMIAPKKYTHNATGGSGNNTAANVTLSENANYKMFLFAEFEIFGTRSYANSYEQDKQAQYAYYSSSGLAKSKIRYRTSNTSRADNWWERSAYCSGDSSTSFCSVTSTGTNTSISASLAPMMVPCFRV